MATASGQAAATGNATARGVPESESVSSAPAVSTLPKWPSGQVTGPARSPPSSNRNVPGMSVTSPRGSWRVNSAGSLSSVSTGPLRTGTSPGRTSSGASQIQQQSTLQAAYGAAPPLSTSTAAQWPPHFPGSLTGSGSMHVSVQSPRQSYQPGHQSPPQMLRSVEVLPGSVRGPPSSPPVPGPGPSPCASPIHPAMPANMLGASSKGTLAPSSQSPLLTSRSPVMPTRSMSPTVPLAWGAAASGLIEAAASQRQFSPRPPSPGLPPSRSPGPPPARNTIPAATIEGMLQNPAGPVVGSPSWQPPPMMSVPQQPSLVPPLTGLSAVNVVNQVGTTVSTSVSALPNTATTLANTTVLVGPGDKGYLFQGTQATMQPPLPTGLGVTVIPKAGGVPLQPEQDISSIHALSPSSRSELQIPELVDADKKDILDHCRDTTKMVNQLAAVLKGLEADVDNLRKENQNLRKTVAQGLQLDGQSKAASHAIPSQAGSTEPRTVAAENDIQGALTNFAPSVAPLVAPGPARNMSGAAPNMVSSIGSLGNEPAGQQTPNRTTAPLMQASPRFGQTPQPYPSPLKAGPSNWPFPSAAPGPLTPSPARRLVPQGGVRQPDSPIGTLASPPLTAESVATIVGPMSTHEASPELATPTPAVVHERGEAPGKVAAFPQYAMGPGDARRKVPPTVYEMQPGQAMDGLLWHMDQTIWLGSDVDEERVRGMAQVLASDTIVSVIAAVEGLNRGTLKCSDDFCIAYSMSNNSYYLLYKRGLEEKAHALQRQILHGVANAVVAASMPTTIAAVDEEGSTTRTATPTYSPNIATVAGRPTQAVSSIPAPVATVSRVQPQTTTSGASTGQQPQYAPVAPASEFTATPSLRSEVVFTNMKNSVDAELSFSEMPSVSVTKAEITIQELLAEQLRRGIQPSEEQFDSVITAVGGDGAGTEDAAKAEEWFWKAIEIGTVPGEASFNTVMLLACREGDVEKAEAVMLQMVHFRLRGSPEIFDIMIRMFSERRDALKVEEWLLNAGQSGWTPGQEAFESVVQLFAQIDAAKAEEWLSRAQQTEYRLPDLCFDVVIRAFLRVSNASKANEWLSRMLNDGRSPSESTLQEAVTLLIESGDVPHAEAWLAQLASRYSVPVDAHCFALFNAAMNAGDFDCAERQLEAIGDTDPGRTQALVMAHSNRGDAARAKAVLERYRKLGGVPTAEINLAMLSTCAAAEDREGAQALARMLAHSGNLTMSEFPLLQRAMGDEQASAIMKELGLGLSTTSGTDLGLSTASDAVAPPAHRRERGGSSTGGRSPSAKASTKGPVRRGGGRGSRAMR